MKVTKLLGMELHEIKKLDDWLSAVRVPGGWIYNVTTVVRTDHTKGTDQTFQRNSVFVPEPVTHFEALCSEVLSHAEPAETIVAKVEEILGLLKNNSISPDHALERIDVAVGGG